MVADSWHVQVLPPSSVTKKMKVLREIKNDKGEVIQTQEQEETTEELPGIKPSVAVASHSKTESPQQPPSNSSTNPTVKLTDDVPVSSSTTTTTTKKASTSKHPSEK